MLPALVGRVCSAPNIRSCPSGVATTVGSFRTAWRTWLRTGLRIHAATGTSGDIWVSRLSIRKAGSLERHQVRSRFTVRPNFVQMRQALQTRCSSILAMRALYTPANGEPVSPIPESRAERSVLDLGTRDCLIA